MQPSRASRFIVFAAVLLAVSALYLVWRWHSPDANAPPDSPPQTELASPPPPANIHDNRPRFKRPPIAARQTRPAADPAEEPWKDRLNEVLAGNETEDDKATSLLDLLWTAPEPGQVEIIQHVANLLSDERYTNASALLTNLSTSTNVIEILMTDLLNRPESVKLPVWVQILGTESHPRAEEARELLQHYLDHDYGPDPGAWDQAVRNWLKEHQE